LPVFSTRAWRSTVAAAPVRLRCRKPVRDRLSCRARPWALPGQNRHVFDDSNVERILRGDSFIDTVPQVFRTRMLEKNVVRLVKREVGEPSWIHPVGRRGYSPGRSPRRLRCVEEFGVTARASGGMGHHLVFGPSPRASRRCAMRGIPLVRPLSPHHYRAATCPTAGGFPVLHCPTERGRGGIFRLGPSQATTTWSIGGQQRISCTSVRRRELTSLTISRPRFLLSAFSPWVTRSLQNSRHLAECPNTLKSTSR